MPQTVRCSSCSYVARLIPQPRGYLPSWNLNDEPMHSVCLEIRAQKARGEPTEPMCPRLTEAVEKLFYGR